jgi:hypothetical protein
MVFSRMGRWCLVLECAKPVQHVLQECVVFEVIGIVIVMLATYVWGAVVAVAV